MMLHLTLSSLNFLLHKLFCCLRITNSFDEYNSIVRFAQELFYFHHIQTFLVHQLNSYMETYLEPLKGSSKCHIFDKEVQ